MVFQSKLPSLDAQYNFLRICSILFLLFCLNWIQSLLRLYIPDPKSDLDPCILKAFIFFWRGEKAHSLHFYHEYYGEVSVRESNSALQLHSQGFQIFHYVGWTRICYWENGWKSGWNKPMVRIHLPVIIPEKFSFIVLRIVYSQRV